MNEVIFSGRMYQIPKASYAQIDDEKILCCRFVVGVKPLSVINSEIDYFSCFATGEAAIKVKSMFKEGCNIFLRGRMRNLVFKDENQTSHYTNVVLVETVEMENSQIEENGKIDIAATTDYKEQEENFLKLMEAGYLPIDEEYYYSIAMKNFS